ncbi:MAG: hypothetical protein HQM08_16960 [Candidatus Riflebacteria bacterium]|nr:hypothetical protein [Candidatus Riflebacteria bacterium]
MKTILQPMFQRENDLKSALENKKKAVFQKVRSQYFIRVKSSIEECFRILVPFFEISPFFAL